MRRGKNRGQVPVRALLLFAALLLSTTACAASADQYYERGQREAEAGHLAAASRNFHHCIEQDPARGDAYLALGRIYLEEEKWSTAANAFRQAALADPRLKAKTKPLLIGALYRDATYEARLGKQREAIASFGQLFEQDPDYPGLRTTYTAVLLKYGRDAIVKDDYVTGIIALKEALRVDPDNKAARAILERTRFAAD